MIKSQEKGLYIAPECEEQLFESESLFCSSFNTPEVVEEEHDFNWS